MFLGCRAGEQPQVPEEETQQVGQARRSAARWVFHPVARQRVTGRLRLADGELLVDRGGSRWWIAEGKAPEPSPWSASEPLVHVVREGRRFAFVGSSGRVLLSREPLGPFTDVRRPPQPWLRAAAFERLVIGISASGRLHRSGDLGKSWERLSTQGAFFSGIAFDARGRALALGVPERWYLASAEGRDFRPLVVDPVGPRHLSAPGGDVTIEGTLSDFTLEGESFVRRRGPPTQLERTGQLPEHASAEALRSDRLAYGHEVVGVRPVAERHGWKIVRGVWGAPLEAQEESPTFSCSSPRVVASRYGEVIACRTKAKEKARWELRWRKDGETKFESVPPLVSTGSEEPLFSLSGQGTLAIGGVCSGQPPDGECRRRGLFLARRDEESFEAVPLPGADELAAISFMGTKEVLFAMSRRAKDGHVLLLRIDLKTPKVPQIIDLTRELHLEHKPAQLRLLPGRRDLMGVMIGHSHGISLATLTAEGTFLTRGQAPAGAMAVHGAGARFVGVDPGDRILWESLDGGTTWASSMLPRDPCGEGKSSCDVALACIPAGCAIGRELTRVGWGTTEEDSLSKHEVSIGSPGRFETSLLIRCKGKNTNWEALEGIQAFPGAGDAALGDADWAQIEADWSDGTVRFIRAHRGAAQVSRQQALGPVSDPRRYALHVSHQIEGTAAVRYKTPDQEQGERFLSDIQVAWDNRVTHVVGHGRLQQRVENRSGDYGSGQGNLAEAHPGLVSVAGAGLYLRLHRKVSPQDPTYFFVGDRVVQLGHVNWPKAIVDQDDSEFVRVGGQHMPLLFSPSRSAVTFRVGGKNEGRFLSARLLALESDDPRLAQGVSIGYRGDRLGFISQFANPDGSTWSAYFAELGGPHGLLPARPVPLKADLGQGLRPCSEQERKETPRVVAPDFPGPSPRVIVSAANLERRELSTGRAVLHGSPEQPCVAAWEAGMRNSTSRKGPKVHVLILPRAERLDGWVFRAVRGIERRPEVTAMPLTCQEERL